MATLTDYKDLDVLSVDLDDPNITGEGGRAINDNFLKLADRTPTYSSDAPTTADDEDAGFFPGSLWFDEMSETMWICTDATPSSAEWRSLFRRETDTLIFVPGDDGAVQVDDLSIDASTIASLSNSDITLAPDGTGKVIVDASAEVMSNNTSIPTLSVKSASSQTADIIETRDGSDTVRARVTADGSFSNKQGQTNSEAFGDDATVASDDSVAVGNKAATTNANAVSVGYFSKAGTDSIAVGYVAGKNQTSMTRSVLVGSSAGASGVGSGGLNNCVMVGYHAGLNTANTTSTTGNHNVFVGYEAGKDNTTGYGNTCVGSGAEPGNHDYCVVLGLNAEATADRQFVSMCSSVYFYGISSSSLKDVTIYGTNRTGTDVDGSNLTLAGGAGTGTGHGGKLTFKTAPAGSTGSTSNALVDAGQFDADATSGNTRFLIFDVDSGQLQRVKVGSNGSGPSSTGRALYIDDDV